LKADAGRKAGKHILPAAFFLLFSISGAPAEEQGESSAPTQPRARIRVEIPAAGGPIAYSEMPVKPLRTNAGEKSDPAEKAPDGKKAALEGDGGHSGKNSADAAAKVLAVFAGKPITNVDVMRELWLSRGGETLDWMIGRAIILRELARLGLEVTEQEVDERLAEHLKRLRRVFPNLDDPDALAGAASGMRIEEYRQRSVWAELALRKIMRKTLPPTEAQLRTYYAERRADFIQPERALVSQVFIAPPADPENDGVSGPDDWALAERQILEAHTRLRMGENFASVARAYGMGGTLSRWVTRGELLRELEDAAFAMRPGSFSAPIRTSMGYHIIKNEEKTDRRLPEFEEAREAALAAYEEKFFVLMAGEFMAKLREDALRDGSLVLGESAGTGGLEAAHGVKAGESDR
jgi:hypothetical protein